MEILQLAEVLPLSSGAGEEPDSIIKGAGGRSWRPVNEDRMRPLQTLAEAETNGKEVDVPDPASDSLSALRLHVKRRLWNEAAGGAHGPKAQKKRKSTTGVSGLVKAQLQKEWLLHFSSYSRSALVNVGQIKIP